MQNIRNLILLREYILIANIILSRCSEKCHISRHRTIEWEIQENQSKAAWQKVVGNSILLFSFIFSFWFYFYASDTYLF